MRKFLRAVILLALALALIPVRFLDAQQSSVVGGLGVGQTIPAFRLRGHDGGSYDFNRVKGPKGLALLFFRSADW
jgi:hypothetical protein